jgi:uncharacterized membrane protein YtjA (UPF0391 family)
METIGPGFAPKHWETRQDAFETTSFKADVLTFNGDIEMLYWAAIFFIIALVAAVLGFGGIAAGAAGIAKILFFVFLILFIVALLMGRRTPA